MFIRIRGDNGFPECPECKHLESPVCDRCEDADRFELVPDAALETLEERRMPLAA